MDTIEEEPSPHQNGGYELFILFMLEAICMIGSMAIIVLGVEYNDSFSNALLISFAVVILLFGFIFDRGAMFTNYPLKVQEHIWWFGPSVFAGFILMRMLIMGSLFEQTLSDLGLFLAIVFGL